jgi:polyvinyl alcohol dehydrogenase (cytochrome)
MINRKAFTVAFVVCVSAVVSAWADTIPGLRMYEAHCSKCHNNKGGGQEYAPPLAALQVMTPERIYAAITTGSMRLAAEKLKPEQKRELAESLSGRVLGAGDTADAKHMPNQCASKAPPADLQAPPRWDGWGNSLDNARFQSFDAGGIDAKNVGRLKLQWAFGFPGGINAYGQPTVAGGRVYVGSDNGYVYALDSKSGCVYWSYAAKAGVRTAPLVGHLKTPNGQQDALFFGDYRANVYAVDPLAGTLLWEQNIADHPYARIVGSIIMAEGRLFVPMSNWEDVAVNNPTYECCTARGSVIALDADSGRVIWKSYTIPEEPKPTKKNANGVQQYAPAGAMVWLTPTIDIQARRVYVGTSDGKGEIAAPQSDAIVAFNMDTGKLEWWYQGWAGDSHGTAGYVDYDFGSSAVLTELPNGRRLLVAVQKSGVIHALDPDDSGKKVWEARTSVDGKKTRGWRPDAVIWGPAMHDNIGYFALVDGSITAFDIKSGDQLWVKAPQSLDDGASEGKPTSNITAGRGRQAAVTAIPGAIFSGSVDGMLRAYSSNSGTVLWEFDTAREFGTVNKVNAKGGTISGPGPAVAGGMIFVNSGYGMLHATPGNVLLAFAVE